MKKYLVIGLESTCTRVVARLLALNLGLINSIDGWDGEDIIESNKYSVTHRSIPHGSRLEKRIFPSLKDVLDFDIIVITSRDINCSLQSKIKSHQPDMDVAIQENDIAIKNLKEILVNKNAVMFSYESAHIFQDAYINQFLKSLDIDSPITIEFDNINKKYFMRKEDE
jgi:hypothetical protein